MYAIRSYYDLDDERYADDLEAVLSRAEAEGVGAFVIPGADARSLPRAAAIAESHANVYFAVGIHPYDLDGYDEALFDRYLSHPKCVAVGECGLDYYRLEGGDAEKAEEKRVITSYSIHYTKLYDLDGGAEHVARGDLRDVKRLGQKLRLGSFACARRAE